MTANDDPRFVCPKRPDGKPRLTVLLTTLNEERHVDACLESVRSIADAIVTVDSFSTDRTGELAARFGEVWKHEFFGAAAQKNWAIPRIDTDWLFVIDADERIPAALAHEIRETVDRNSAEPAGYYVHRKQFALGAHVAHSGWKADAVIRLVRQGRGRYPNRRVHADMVVDGTIGRLATSMDHHTFERFGQYLPKIERFANWGAAQAFRDGRRAGTGTIFGRAIWRFVRTWIFQFGFLDGWRGLVVCGVQAWGTFLKWSWVAQWTDAERTGRPIEGMPKFDIDDASLSRSRSNSPNDVAVGELGTR